MPGQNFTITLKGAGIGPVEGLSPQGSVAQCKQRPEPGWCNKPASSLVDLSGTALPSSGISNSRNSVGISAGCHWF